VKGNELKKRMKALRERQADVWLPAHVFNRLRDFVRGADQNYKQVDASILLLPEKRVKELRALLDGAPAQKDGATIHMSYLDMIELEQVSRYAESFPEDYSGNMKPKDIMAFTEKLGEYRKAAFPDH
jgi:hypothetical protein